MRLLRMSAVVALVVAAGNMSAQGAPETYARAAPPQAQADIVVKTVPLHHLSSNAAMKLLQPYVRTPGGGVYDVPPPTRAVTIRETMHNYLEMMAVLQQYDHDPATVTLNFQLIAAENTGTRDPALAGLDSLLRGALKYTGYKLLTTAVASASEFGVVSQTLSVDGDAMTLSVDVTDVRVDPAGDGAKGGGGASVHLSVNLERDAVAARSGVQGRNPKVLLMTGVTVPIGQTVVLGTSAVDGTQRALILTVRPQLSGAKR